MSFKIDKIKPKFVIDELPILYKNVRSTNKQTARADKQCFKCMGKIGKGTAYINHAFRYSTTIKTINFHENCF